MFSCLYYYIIILLIIILDLTYESQYFTMKQNLDLWKRPIYIYLSLWTKRLCIIITLVWLTFSLCVTQLKCWLCSLRFVHRFTIGGVTNVCTLGTGNRLKDYNTHKTLSVGSAKIGIAVETFAPVSSAIPHIGKETTDLWQYDN